MQVEIAFIQLGANHLESGIDEHTTIQPWGSFRAMIVVVERGVTVVKAEEAIGHARLPGELDRLVGEPERFFTEPDPAVLAGPRVEPACCDDRKDQGDATEGDQSRENERG